MGAGPGFTVVLDCPGCGASLEVDPEARSVPCACGRSLGLGWHGREAVFALEPRLWGEAQLRDALVLERVSRHAAGLRARDERTGVARDALDPSAEEERRRRLKNYERDQAAALRVVEARRLALPLWRLWGRDLTLAAVDGRRHFRLSEEAWAETVPAHAAELALRVPPPRLERARVRPLTPAPERLCVPWQAPPETRGERARAAGVGVRVRVGSRRALLYWPCWLARVIDTDRQSFVLVDGLAGGVLARPSAPDARRLLATASADPGAGGVRTPPAQAWPSVCPECQQPVRLAGRDQVIICDVCRRALAVTPAGLAPRPYASAQAAGTPAPGAWLPFWRFELRLETGAGAPLGSLEALSERYTPGSGPTARGEALLVPAFDVTSDAGLAALPALLAQVHALDWQMQDGGLDPGGDALCARASLDEEGARELAALTLLMALGPQALSRLAGVVSGAPPLVLGGGRRLLLGFQPADGGLALPGQPALLPSTLVAPGPSGSG